MATTTTRILPTDDWHGAVGSRPTAPRATGVNVCEVFSGRHFDRRDVWSRTRLSEPRSTHAVLESAPK